MEKNQPLAYSAADAARASLFPETQVIIENGAQSHLRVTVNNDSKGVVEVEFHELYEIPFRYPLQRIN